MESKNNFGKYMVSTSMIEWKPLLEENVDTRGISYKVLLYDEDNQRPKSFILKFEEGASYPLHNHPGGEEAFILEGEVFFNGVKLIKGDYLYTPKNYKHSVKSETGCQILFMVPEEVEIIKSE
ncbi:cupin domain-containing protein [Sphingobacterium daejeonense]|uniref:cupin domain-containing protein n=1 Tax=Sphingobacterium daejeonense TaxID=371142 RepID=UPI0021A443BC|nr:cupin domain-containing protein [Sphingobacterium daejeonense]MCT1533153.1 cupin domain-containing protein [Sphingobacterium daejeonense]